MTDSADRFGGRHWIWVALLAGVTITVAPFMGLLRDALLNRFPGTALKGLAALLAAVFLMSIAVTVRGALLRADRKDRRRWLWLGVALLSLGAQLLGFQSGSLQVDVVEKVHVVQYGLLAFLTANAVRQSRWGNAESSDGQLRIEHVWLPICLGTTVGAVDESVQGFFQLRTGDIRDVGLNGLASVTGACFAAAVAPWRRITYRLSSDARRYSARATAAMVFVVGGFFLWAHLGYDIRDPEIGRFRSWYDADTLDRLAEERRRSWRRNPPTGLEAWAPEDYFLTEAAWHANHRNERLQTGDWPMAQQANRILETYYDPFLDLESFRGSGKHRWDPELKADVARRVEQSGQGIPPELYVSPVLYKRIYAWSKPVFVSIWLGVILTVLWLGRRGQR